MCRLLLLLSFLASPLLASSWEKTVSQDGSGDYRTVLEAVLAAPTGTLAEPSVIRIRPGYYNERLYIQREKRFLRLVGEDPLKTTINYHLHANILGEDGKAIGTFRTPSVYIDADDFSATGLTFSNSAGPVGQALAIRLDGDRAAFHNCRFLGWQDTILTNRGRHYFENCYIEGHVDFIFGGATAYFLRCHIHCLKDGYITAASTPQEQLYGFVFNQCKITAAGEQVRTYLGRPWRIYAHTIFLNTEMGSVVKPEGWHNWKKPEAESTTRYGEFNSTGPGSNPSARVSWARSLTQDQAAALSPERVLAGSDAWVPPRP